MSGKLAREVQENIKKGTAPNSFPRKVELVTELPETNSGPSHLVELHEGERALNTSREPAQKRRRSMFCPTCGAATTTSAHFCDACGSPLLPPGSFSDGPPSPAVQPTLQQAVPGAMAQRPVASPPGGTSPGVARPGPDAAAIKQQIRLLRQQVKGVRLQLQEVNIQLTQIHTQFRQGSPFVPYGLVRRFYREVENVRLSGLQRQKQALRQQIVGLEQQILALENSQYHYP